MIIDIHSSKYKAYRSTIAPKGSGKYNGAYFYSKEITQNIIPNVKTGRNWDTLGMRGIGSLEHAIVFIHHCISWDRVYGWLDNYKDHVYVVSTKPSYNWFVEHGKRTILLPLSIDVKYVEQFRTEKTKGACYAGNRWAFKREDEDKYIPSDVDFPPKNIPRHKLLRFIAPYRELYAIGRCALEGKVLGCEIKPFYRAYPDPSYWKVIDNTFASSLLQRALDKIESGEHSVNCFEFYDYKIINTKCNMKDRG